MTEAAKKATGRFLFQEFPNKLYKFDVLARLLKKAIFCLNSRNVSSLLGLNNLNLHLVNRSNTKQNKMSEKCNEFVIVENILYDGWTQTKSKSKS